MTTTQTYFLSDPSSRLNWSHNWVPFLGEGDSITSRLWTITPIHPGTPEMPALTNPTTATVFVEGMLAGNVYRLTEHITTLNGVQDEWTIVIRCDQT